MSNENFNMSMRKFLKQVGVTSQQAIEEHVRKADLDGGQLAAKMTLTIEGAGVVHEVKGLIDLD